MKHGGASRGVHRCFDTRIFARTSPVWVVWVACSSHPEALMPPIASSPILGIRASQVVVYVVCLCVWCCLCPCQGQTCPNLSPDGDVTRALPPVSCLWLGKQGPRDLSLAPHWATQLSELKLPSPVANRPNFPRLSRTFPIGGLIASS